MQSKTAFNFWLILQTIHFDIKPFLEKKHFTIQSQFMVHICKYIITIGPICLFVERVLKVQITCINITFVNLLHLNKLTIKKY
jgi:hypothetical protein